MISRNDLYDITAAFIIVRSDIKHELNSAVLDEIVKVLGVEDQKFEDNQIRKAIASIDELDREKWFYAYNNNFYVNHMILDDRRVYRILIKLCILLRQLLELREYEKAYDLLDSFHCLPDIIADNNFSITKSYWRTYVKNYRNKWDKNFLKKEQKDFKTIKDLWI